MSCCPCCVKYFIYGLLCCWLRRRQWHPTPVLLLGKSHGWRSLVWCSPWGHWESDTTEWLHFHFSPSCIGEENGNPLQCSCLESLRDGGAWWAAIYGVAQSQTQLKWLSSSSSMLLAYVTPPRPNLRVCLGFSVCPLGLSFHFVWYSQISFVIFETYNDVKWRKRIGKKQKQKQKPCLLLSKSGTFSGRKGSTSFLKSPKVTNRSKINIYKKCLVI